MEQINAVFQGINTQINQRTHFRRLTRPYFIHVNYAPIYCFLQHFNRGRDDNVFLYPCIYHQLMLLANNSKLHEVICIHKSFYELICAKQFLDLVKYCEMKVEDHTHVIGLNQLLPNFLFDRINYVTKCRISW